MKPISCSLLALAAAIALWGQPTRGSQHIIKHTISSGVLVDSDYTCNVEPRGTVAELKEKLAGQYQAPMDMFHVIWKGNEQPDNFDLEQLRDSAPNNLYLVFDSFLVKVIKPESSYVILGGEKEETVASFKDKIAKRLNIPREMQRIIDTTREFQDGEQLASNLKLVNNRASYIVSLVLKPAQVRIKFPSGEIIKFEYELPEMVVNLKNKIQRAIGIARERQSLLLRGVGELDDHKLLVSLGLSKSSTLTLVEQDPNALDIIYVRLESGRLLTFEVSLTSDTVASLKEKISRAEGLAQERQHLFLFKGKEMVNARLLGDYITESESVVDLLLCSGVGEGEHDAAAEHHVHLGLVGQEIPLEGHLNIKPDDTVATVKEAVRLIKSVPPEYKMHIFFENNELDDNKPLLEHVIANGSMLQITGRRRDGPEMIHVRLPTGRLITFDTTTSRQVGTLMDRVQRELEAYKTSKKCLFYGNQELSDDKTLDDYNIVNGSTVSLILAKPDNYP